MKSLSSSVTVSLTAAGLAFCAAIALKLPLAFDGSRFIFHIIDQQGSILEHGRRVNALLQAPAVLVALLGSGMNATAFTYSFTYGILPFLSLLLSWHILQWGKNPPNRHLIVWPFLGIGLIASWGCNFPAAEGTYVSYLFWPVLLGFLVNAMRAPWYCWALLIFSLGTHPTASLLCVILAAMSFLQYQERIRLLLPTGFILLSIVPFLHRDAYEAERMDPHSLAQSFYFGVWGLPLAGILAALFLGALLYFRIRATGADRADERKAIRLNQTRVVLMLAYLVIELKWLTSQAAFTYPSRFRYFALILELPLVPLCWAHYSLARRMSHDRLARVEGSVSAATVFSAAALSLALLSQSLTWSSDLRVLRSSLENTVRPCIEYWELPSNIPTIHPVYLPILSLLVQDERRPERFAATSRGQCSQPKIETELQLLPWDPPVKRNHSGWMDLSQAGRLR